MRSVGIDIGRFAIKVVELTAAANRGFQFTGAKIYPLNQKEENHEIEILQILKQIHQDFDTDNAKVTSSIRQNYVSMRKVFFPFKERQKILKSLAFEIEDDIPYSIDKSVFDAKILSIQDSTSEVMAMAAPIEELQLTLDMYLKAGIDPDILSPEFSALSNLFQPKWYLSPQDIAKQLGDDDLQERLVVHIGHGRSFAGVVQGEKLLWGRGILWGAEKIALDISKTFQVPFTEALKMMPTKAFLLMMTEKATQDQKKMSDTIAKTFQPLIEALRLTIIMANTEFETQISQVEIFGGASEIKNLGSFLTQALELPVNLHNPLENYNPEKVKALLPHKQTCLMSFGLAIEGLKRPVNPAVNFRQNDLAKKNQTFEKFWEKWGYTAKVVAIAWVCFLIAGIVRNSIATDLEEQSYDLLSSTAKKVAGIKNFTHSKARTYIRNQKKKVDLVKHYDAVGDIVAPGSLINQISSIMPPNNKAEKYDVRHLSIKGDVLSLHGFADGPKVIKEIERNLKSLAVGRKIESAAKILPKEAGRTGFSYKFKVKRKN